MNESLDDLLKRSRRVAQAQSERIAASDESPRPGFVDRVVQPRAASVDERLDRLMQLTQAARWGLALGACAVLTLWGLPPSASSRAASIDAAVDAWSSVTGPDTITWEDFGL